MHKKNIKPNVLCLANDDFINSLEELKEYLFFNLTFSKHLIDDLKKDEINVILIDGTSVLDLDKIKILNNSNDKSKLLISDSNKNPSILYDEQISRPIIINELNNKVIQLFTRKNFNINSSIKINSYILDKNEKKISKNNNFTILTEKEIQLLELLINTKKPLPKKEILNNVWKYSSDADTHTVETHIYRLRKKIFDKFKDEKFILSKKNGYKI